MPMSDRYTRRLALVLSALEKADGRALSYRELAALGVEQPAQTVYELEIAGEAIIHVPGGVQLGSRTGRPGAGGRR